MAFLVQAPLARACGRLGCPAPAARPGSLLELLEDPLRRELSVAQLRPFVLGDGTHERPDPIEDAAAFGLAEPGRRLDVEERLDPRRALLRMLPAGPARP